MASSIAKTSEPRRSFRKARRVLHSISARQQRRRLKAYRRMDKLVEQDPNTWTPEQTRMAEHSTRILYDKSAHPWQ